MKEGRLEGRCAFVEFPRTDLHRRSTEQIPRGQREHSGAQRSNGLIVIQHTQMKEAIHGGCGWTDVRINLNGWGRAED